MARKLLKSLLMGLVLICGAGSLVLFGALPVGSRTLLPMNWPLAGVLVWDAALCLVFFLQHSGMVRRGARRRMSGVVTERYQRAVYSIASGVALVAVVLLWQTSGVHVVVLEGPWRLIARASALGAVAVFIWGALVLRGVDLFGLAAIQADLRGTAEAPAEFVVRGPYRWVRHPWYAAAIVLFWSSVDLTADRLLFNVLWTVWICLGARWEENDLKAELGEVYERYAEAVPMLIPWRGACRTVTSGSRLDAQAELS